MISGMRRTLIWPGQSIFRPWRFLPRYRRLVEHGAQAPAVVLANDVIGSNQSIRRLRLRVHFDDGEAVEITRIEAHRSASVMEVGKRVPVRYDERDRRRIQVDPATFDAGFQRWLARAQTGTIRRTEAELERERREDP